MPRFPYIPYPPGYQNMRASLDPPTTQQRADNPDVQWVREQVYEPTPWRPLNPFIGEQFRRYTADVVLNETANTEVPRIIQIDIPATLYGLTGAAVDSTGAALPVGLDPLDTFLVRFEHNNGDRIDTQAALGSAMLGTAKFPALLGGPAWHFDRGSSINIGITPLRSNLRIYVVAWMMEYRGPANYNPLG